MERAKHFFNRLRYPSSTSSSSGVNDCSTISRMLVSLEEKGAEREEMLLKIEIARARRLAVAEEEGEANIGLMNESWVSAEE